jgi:flagellar biosynthetic protein FliR
VGIGLAIGLAARLVIAAMEVAGEAIGLQMGLSFASFFDPASNLQLSAVSRFLVQIFTLFFIVVNGHLFVLMAVIKSFDVFPVDGSFLQAVAQMRLHELGSAVFESALWIALPMMALLLFVNLTMGVIARIAPQMNVFAIGFPITLTVGMLGITATLPMMEQPFLQLIERALSVFGGGFL